MTSFSVLVSRNTSDLLPLAKETGARLFEADASTPEGADQIFEALDAMPSSLGVAVYNPSARVRGATEQRHGDAL